MVVAERERVDEFIRDAEAQLEYLQDELRSLQYLGVKASLEILKELREQRRVLERLVKAIKSPVGTD